MWSHSWIYVKGHSLLGGNIQAAGSHVTSRLASDLSARQVNARTSPRAHIAVSVTISMIKHREIERDGERKRKKRGMEMEWPHWRPVAEIFGSWLTIGGVSAASNIALILFSAAKGEIAAMHREIPQLPSFSLSPSLALSLPSSS